LPRNFHFAILQFLAWTGRTRHCREAASSCSHATQHLNPGIVGAGFVAVRRFRSTKTPCNQSLMLSIRVESVHYAAVRVTDASGQSRGRQPQTHPQDVLFR